MNNTGSDQPLCNSFCGYSIIFKLATGKIIIFYLVPVAEETDLKVSKSAMIRN